MPLKRAAAPELKTFSNGGSTLIWKTSSGLDVETITFVCRTNTRLIALMLMAPRASWAVHFPTNQSSGAKAVVTELLGRLAMHHRKKDELVSAAIYATALRRLAPRYVPFDPHDHSLQTTLNYRFGMNPPTYAYQAVDSLKQMLIDKLAEHGITDTEGEQQTGEANA
jgi:hypothetical protein